MDLTQEDINGLAAHAMLTERRGIPDTFRLLTSLGCSAREANKALASIDGVVNIAGDVLDAWALSSDVDVKIDSAE